MPSFMARLRPRSTGHEDQPSPAVSQTSGSPQSILDSKIAPNISALFASAEDEPMGAQSKGLKPSRRPARKTIPKPAPDSIDVSKPTGRRKGKVREASLDETRGKRRKLSSFEDTTQAGWPTFGRDEDPSHADMNMLEQPRTIPRMQPSEDNSRPIDLDAPLSWSPRVDVTPRSTGTSVSSPSSQLLHETAEPGARRSIQSFFHSPSPRTFGHPTPVQQSTPSDSPPALPFPPFQSTPKSALPPRYSMPEPSPMPSLSRFRFATGVNLTPLSSTFGRVMRSHSERPKASSIFSNVPTTELGEQKRRRTPSRRSTLDSTRKGLRRQSAEYNAQAATAGIAASASQTQDLGWQAEVSREMVRLSLGRQSLGWDVQAATQTEAVGPVAASADGSGANSAVRPARNRSISAPGNSRRRKSQPCASHELHDARQLINPADAEQGLSSSHLLSLHRPPPSSSSSAAAVPVSVPKRPLEDSAVQNARSQPTASRRILKKTPPPTDNVLYTLGAQTDSYADDDTSKHMIQNNRTENEEQVKWASRKLSTDAEAGAGDRSAIRPSASITQSGSASTYRTAGSSSFLHAPSLSVIAPTPQGSLGRSRKESAADSELEGEGKILNVPTLPQSDKVKGKRKAEDSEDGSPPGSRGSKGKKTTFAAEGGRPHQISNASHAPSSFQSFTSQKSRKRVRLSSPMATPDQSRRDSANTSNVGATSSLDSLRSAISGGHLQRPGSRVSILRPPSRSKSVSGASSSRGGGPSAYADLQAKRRSRSLSQTSIPLSAIIAPRAPSVDRLSTFYMRDPRRPPPQRAVDWRLHFAEGEDEGSPVHAWAFWIGFFVPVLWWIASVWRIPQTRMVGTDTEKAVVVDDPHVEREARTWRFRCRIASVVFFFTYAPVIILLAIFAPRS